MTQTIKPKGIKDKGLSRSHCDGVQDAGSRAAVYGPRKLPEGFPVPLLDWPQRRSKNDTHRLRLKINAPAVCYAPALLGNPSQFAVYATVRRSVLARWKNLQGATSDSDDTDEEPAPIISAKIPKITGIGLRTVFSLVLKSLNADPNFCVAALEAMDDVLQGHVPEELAHEPTEIIAHLHTMLDEIAAGSAPPEAPEVPTRLTSLGTSCLISLVVARGEAELILKAVASLIMSPLALMEQLIQSLVTSFPVDLPPAITTGSTELVVRSLVSDGCFLYVQTSRGLLKFGSGYGSSIKQHVYLYKADFFASDHHGWLGICKGKLYVRIGRKRIEVYEVDKDTLEIRNLIKLDPGISDPAEPKSAVFSDGHQLGVMMLTNNSESLSIRFFDIEKTQEPDGDDSDTLRHHKELTVPLLRKRNLAIGRASYEDVPLRRDKDNDTPTAMQLDENEDDPLMSISCGAEFGLLVTASGKAAPQSGRWTLMKETLFNKNDFPNLRSHKVVQVAVGHEGVHAILVLDNGAVALGKAHAVVLNQLGQVYTFGINNKGQCGPEDVAEGKNAVQTCQGSHTWLTEYCRVCVRCCECTGFASACNLSHMPARVPGERCGCGDGDSGCVECGICRQCAYEFSIAAQDDMTGDDLSISLLEYDRTLISDKDSKVEGQASDSDVERDAAIKVSCLPPARVAIPGGHRIAAVACGLHHTFGQLGAGDIAPHHRLVKVKVPKAASIAAGSNHSAVMTRDGERGSLGRVSEHASGRGVWYASPAPVPRIGLQHACRAVWLSASADQTFIQSYGVCTAWGGAEQVDFVNTLACLDPLYDVLWCYQPQMRVMKCYNILAFDSHKLQRRCNRDLDSSESGCPSTGNMCRLEDFKDLKNFELGCSNGGRPVESIALADTSILNQELAIPAVHGALVTRMHIALHLLGCLDSLIYVHDNKLNTIECKREAIMSPLKADWLTVTRFENHGGGWGYNGHSIEAIRFMSDTDIILGNYTAKIKLFDLGHDGGDHEGEGELIAESENAMLINDDIGFHFKTSKKSNNGTDVNAGQIPSLLYNLAGSDHSIPPRIIDMREPIITLTKNLSRKVTVPCFKTLISLLTWSWDSFREVLLDTNGLVPINYKKLLLMKRQKRLVYVIRACLRLVKSYVCEIMPQNSNKKLTYEHVAYLDCIGEVKTLIQDIVAEETPKCSMLRRHSSKTKNRSCLVQFALELNTSILKEAHETTIACFHVFFPTPALKWAQLSSMLHHVRLTSTCAALCSSRSLRDMLHYIIPVTQSHLASEDKKRPDSKPSTSSEKEKRHEHSKWTILDVIPKFLDIVMNPIKQQMMTRQCGQPHDHGEIKQNEALREYCCKLIVRCVAELIYSANNVRNMESATVKEMLTPSRFMRVNTSRSWNTGNGSPDAICFTVDRPGVVLVGVGVAADDSTSNCWVSLDILQGTFDGSECQNDVALIKFEKYIHLK
ncbi:Esrom, partial [Operophtera brumata]